MKDIIIFEYIFKLMLFLKRNVFIEYWVILSGWEWKCFCRLFECVLGEVELELLVCVEWNWNFY